MDEVVKKVLMAQRSFISHRQRILILFLGKLSTVSPLFCSCYRPLASTRDHRQGSWDLTFCSLSLVLSLPASYQLVLQLMERADRRDKEREEKERLKASWLVTASLRQTIQERVSERIMSANPRTKEKSMES